VTEAFSSSVGPASIASVTRQKGIALLVKRVFDVVGASIALVVLFPLLVLAAIAVKVDSPGPVLFHQRRVGRNGRHFTIHKFRSMVADADPAVHQEYLKAQAAGSQEHYKVEDDDRITRIGDLFRRLSIDELPQLWNVIVGQMSLVGPRPDVPYSLEQYEAHHHRRFDVLPGLTGLWQVSGRSELSLQEMLELDIRYVDEWSFAMDLRLLMRTIPELLRPERAG